MGFNRISNGFLIWCMGVLMGKIYFTHYFTYAIEVLLGPRAGKKEAQIHYFRKTVFAESDHPSPLCVGNNLSMRQTGYRKKKKKKKKKNLVRTSRNCS